MADITSETKLEEMQKYLPFLRKVIERLQSGSNASNSPRKAQLQKMQMLHDLLTSKGKRLKLETLQKCESVLIKLHAKMEKSVLFQTEPNRIQIPTTESIARGSTASEDASGPASPPPQEMEEIQPVEIPTERQCSPLLCMSSKGHKKRQPSTAGYERPGLSHSGAQRLPNNQQHSNNPKESDIPFERRGDRGNQRSLSVPDKRRSRFSDIAISTEVHDRHGSKLNHQNLPAGRRDHPVDTVDLIGDSPSPPPSMSSDDHKQYRNPYPPADHHKACHLDRNIFQRLGDKVVDDTTKDFQNFKINVLNRTASQPDGNVMQKSGSEVKCSAGVGAQFAEVVKSSTTAEHHTIRPVQSVEYLNAGNISLSDIASRRSPKIDTKPNSNDLETVRKKLALISRSSPQLESPASPMSPVPVNTAIPVKPLPKSNPIIPCTNTKSNASAYLDPRIKKSNETHQLPETAQPMSGVNVLPSINPHDPRLRKAIGSNASASVSITTLIPNMYPSSKNMHNRCEQNAQSQRMATGFQYSNQALQDPRITFGNRFHPTNPPYTNQPQIRQRFAQIGAFAQHDDFRRSVTPGPGQTFHRQPNNQSYTPLIRNLLQVEEPSLRAHQHAVQQPSTSRKEYHVEGREQQMLTVSEASQQSSEENWDTDPETDVATNAKPANVAFPAGVNTIYETKNTHSTKEQFNQHQKGYSASNENTPGFKAFSSDTQRNWPTGAAVNNVGKLKSQGSAFTNKQGFRPSERYGNPKTQGGKNFAGASNSAASNRFNAILNDTTERIKYIESKRYRGNEPQTYGEFKAAKARAAAENIKKSSGTKPFITKKTNSEGRLKTAFVSTEKKESVEANPSVISTTKTTESTLDKLYRSSNFSERDFPKAVSSFKIPKKPSTEKKEENIQNSEKEIDNETENNKKPVEDKPAANTTVNSFEQTNTNEHLQQPAVFKKKSKNKVKLKSNPHAKKHPKSELPKTQKPNQADELIITENVANVCSDSLKSPIKSSPIGQIREIPTFKAAGKSEPPKTDPNNKGKVPPIEINVTPNAQPLRITRRRATMIDFGSTPEVDKERLHKANALLFEDIDDIKKRKLKDAENELKLSVRKSRNLAEMFQKTDDNCTVSTQNIVSGKRRTRATMNFNEVQQVKALFRHKMTPEAKKTAETDSPKNTPKIPTNKCKNYATASGSSSLSTKTNSIKSTAMDDIEADQSCAVSSTTCYIDENIKDTATVVATDIAEEEPTSTAKSESGIPSISGADEDSGKQEMLEDFVQNMLRPNTDKEYIFSLLKQILSEEKLHVVRTIINSACNESDKVTQEKSEVNNAEKERTTDLSVDDKSDLKVKVIKPETTKRRCKKRNELDRLNEDIRDMFISQGVITATGRRMCTLVEAAAEEKTNVASSKGHRENEMNKKSKSNRNSRRLSDVGWSKESPRLRKAKVVLSPLKVNELRRSKRTSPGSIPADIEDDSQTSMTMNASTSKVTKTKAEEITLEPVGKNTKRGHKSTRIQIKPCPKSKKIIAAAKKRGRAAFKKRTLAKDTVKCHSNIITHSELIRSETDNGTSKDLSEVVLRNTNPKWHSQSKFAKFCLVCKVPQKFVAMHYKMNHGEYFAARLSPAILLKCKEGKLAKPLFYTMMKNQSFWLYRCPFCLKCKRSTLKVWLVHILTHTGEYRFECSTCFKCSNTRSVVSCHIDKTKDCVGSELLDNGLCVDFAREKLLKAHVCTLCNFLQLSRNNLERHYVQQHDYHPKDVGSMGESFDLFDVTDVPLIEGVKADQIEQKARRKRKVDLKFIAAPDAFIEEKEANDEVELKDVSLKLEEIKCKNIHECEDTKLQGEDRLSKTKQLDAEVEHALNSSVEQQNEQKAAINGNLESVQNILAPITANAFMPSRETTDSPTMQNLALSLRTIEQEEDQSNNTTPKTKGPISIAEKLSQRLKDSVSNSIIKASSVAPVPQNVLDRSETALEDNTPKPETSNMSEMHSIESEKHTFHFEKTTAEATITAANPEITHVKSIITPNDSEKPFTKSKSSPTHTEEVPEVSEVNTTADSDNPKLVIAETVTAVEDLSKDDENWEDIDITESAPSVAASTTSSAGKESRGRTRNLLQKMNRFCNMGKMKKSMSVVGNKRKRIGTTNMDKQSVSPAVSIDMRLSCDSPKGDVAKKPIEIIGFRPMITTLDDLLPDSPCNDPLELEPELAPNEPLQDLTDISSLLDPSFNDTEFTNIDEVNQNSTFIDNKDTELNSIQEALDFISSQDTAVVVSQDRKRPQNSSAGHLIINRIQNIGYSSIDSPNGYSNRFYCLSENCTFLYSSEAIGLESHYLSEHSTVKWNGYCHTCSRQIEPCEATESDGLSFARELRHILNDHIASTPTIAAQNDEDAAQNEETEERPRIKIRRLTGDCLSRTPTNCEMNDTANGNPPLRALSTSNEIACDESLFTNFRNALSGNSASSASEKKILNTSTTQPTCGLQISSVVSLNSSTLKRGIDQMTIPKISSVCSLNELTPDSCHSNTDCDDEVSRFLGSKRIAKPTARDVSGSTDSPSPIVVAETVPVGQAVAGNFVLTQTLSAQYGSNSCGSSSTQLGFNISIAASPSTAVPVNVPGRKSASNGSKAPVVDKMPPLVPIQRVVANRPLAQRPHFVCKGTGCKYQTRVQVAMSDHLRFHERRNFSNVREFLRCAQCNNMAEDIDDYFRHSENEHQAAEPKAGTNMATPLEKQKFRQSLAATLKEMVGSTGIPDDKLYPCVINGCKAVLTESNYNTHIVFHLTALHQTNSILKCPHCRSSYQRTAGLKAHIKSHACHHLFCYVCMTSSANGEQMLKHFTDKHWRPSAMQQYPLLEPKVSAKNIEDKNSDPDASFTGYLVAFDQPLTPSEVQRFAEKLVSDWQRKKAAFKTHFTSNEIDLLPVHPIFAREVNCAECQYRTKVRSNMLRHLQMHRIGAISTAAEGGTHSMAASVDPINPVPCLNSSERHFDKMTNLASSSLVPTIANSNSAAGGGTAPAAAVDSVGSVTSGSKTASEENSMAAGSGKITHIFVPESRRLTCGVPACQYITLSEDVFRSHLNALHPNTVTYQCPFCKEELCKRGLGMDRIVHHMRYHSDRLYRCGDCHYYHYMKPVVERHIHEKHIAQSVDLVTHQRDEDNAMEGMTTSQNFMGKRPKDANTKSTKSSKAAQSSSAKAGGSGTSSGTTKTGGKVYHKWECCICGHITGTQHQMLTHCQSQHDKKHQFQCSHCQFTAHQLNHIHNHIADQHKGSVLEAKHIFTKFVENAQSIDTRPLWQRDDPKRIRHIRGILMEDEDESEQHCRSLSPEEEEADNTAIGGDTSRQEAATATRTTQPAVEVIPEKSLEAFTAPPSAIQPPQTTPELFCGRYWFGCFQCEYKSSSLEELYDTHWKQAHYKSNHPFLCRLFNWLKCPDCSDFTGNYTELQLHRLNTHKSRVLVAADPNTRKSLCAFCNYNYPHSAALSKHQRREHHEPHDLKLLTTAQLQAMLRLCVRQEKYLQCKMCNDLFMTHTSINTHIAENHADVKAHSIGLPYEEIDNTLLYGCPKCVHKGIDELDTMRHMIDHYDGFKCCCFCHAQQVDFNGYMQHCYSAHREAIAQFSGMYTLATIKQFLAQMLVIFPNGLMLNKKNLRYTQYGSEARMIMLYDEICKTAKNPPIPRLSIGQLVARKSVEAQHMKVQSGGNSPSGSDGDHPSASLSTASIASAMQLAGNGIAPSAAAQQMARKISKRRSTVAFCSKVPELSKSVVDSPSGCLETIPKKARLLSSTLPSVPLFKSKLSPEPAGDNDSAPTEPYSFYNKPTTAATDFSKIYTRVNIAGQETSVGMKKLQLLLKINCRVLVRKTESPAQAFERKTNEDASNSSDNDSDCNPYPNVKKPCPACHKHKYA